MKLKKLTIRNLKDEAVKIHIICRIISKIQSDHLPHEKNSEEYSVSVYPNGFRSKVFLLEGRDSSHYLEIDLDVFNKMIVVNSVNSAFKINFDVSSVYSVISELNMIFNRLESEYRINESEFEDYEYISDGFSDMFRVLLGMNELFHKFKSSRIEELSSVNFWPHHFDLALLWFPGNIIKGRDTDDWADSREQINFGFLFGDDLIAKPYIYITFYPFNTHLQEFRLPYGAVWNAKNWKGIVLDYNKFVNAGYKGEDLIKLFNFAIKIFQAD